MKEEQKVLVGLLAITIVVLFLNNSTINQVRAAVNTDVVEPSGSDVMPTGIPEIYGKELGISYDDVSPNDPYAADATIAVMAKIDRSVSLQGKELERYINVLFTLHDGISCEYCCGARSIIFADGKSACGCAHSFAMRGLAKYLIAEHGDEYSDADILEEVGKWKALFFPSQTAVKADILKGKGVEVNFVNLGSNKYRGVEQGNTAGGMVGGC
jgi:hypothetical protein